MKKTIIVILSLLLVLCSCAQRSPENKTTSSDETTEQTTSNIQTTPETTTPEQTTVPSTTEQITTTPEITTEPEPEIFELSLIAVGDNLIHDNLITAGNTFGYDSYYEEIAPLISSADLAIINQESSFSYSVAKGYPYFATPTAVGDSAIKAGFDIFSMATNHTWDWGKQPVLDTIDYFKNRPEATMVGLYETEADRENVTIIEKNNIKIALLNYTYGYNSGKYPNQLVWWMSETLGDKARMTKQLAYAEENADITIVMTHWGKEYVYRPNNTQTSWAQFFADNGADIIIGHHPHVVQPVVELTGVNGNKTICYYSLGNFISNQLEVKMNVGGLAFINIVKDENGTRVDSYDMLATAVHVENVGGVWKYTALLLSEYTDERLSKNVKFGTNGTEGSFKINDYWSCYNQAIKSYP